MYICIIYKCKYMQQINKKKSKPWLLKLMQTGYSEEKMN